MGLDISYYRNAKAVTPPDGDDDVIEAWRDSGPATVASSIPQKREGCLQLWFALPAFVTGLSVTAVSERNDCPTQEDGTIFP